jgi:hypothetical protein
MRTGESMREAKNQIFYYIRFANGDTKCQDHHKKTPCISILNKQNVIFSSFTKSENRRAE